MAAGMSCEENAKGYVQRKTAYPSYHGLFCRKRTENFLHSDVFQIFFNPFFLDRCSDLGFHLADFLETLFFGIAGFGLRLYFVFEFFYVLLEAFVSGDDGAFSADAVFKLFEAGIVF